MGWCTHAVCVRARACVKCVPGVSVCGRVFHPSLSPPLGRACACACPPLPPMWSLLCFVSCFLLLLSGLWGRHGAATWERQGHQGDVRVGCAGGAAKVPLPGPLGSGGALGIGGALCLPWPRGRAGPEGAQAWRAHRPPHPEGAQTLRTHRPRHPGHPGKRTASMHSCHCQAADGHQGGCSSSARRSLTEAGRRASCMPPRGCSPQEGWLCRCGGRG